MKIRTIPYGYKWVCGEYQINQEEKEIIQLIIELYLSDNSMKKIADMLNDNGIEYNTDSVWNKSKIMRVLDDKRYLGNELFPKIISTVEYKNIQIKRNQKNLMNVNERVAHIKLSVHSLCPVCQLPLEYRYRGDCKKQHRWICHNCNTVVEIKEDELKSQITKQLKRIKEDNYLLKQENEIALTTDAIKAKNMVINSLNHGDFDKEVMTNQMLLYASKTYDCITSKKYISLCIMEYLDEWNIDQSFNQDVFDKIVKSIYAFENGSIMLKLINNQILGKEHEIYGTSIGEEGNNNTGNDELDTDKKLSKSTVESGCILPSINETGRTA